MARQGRKAFLSVEWHLGQYSLPCFVDLLRQGKVTFTPGSAGTTMTAAEGILPPGCVRLMSVFR